MARKAKYDWGKTSSSKYQKFETRITHKIASADLTSNAQDSVYIDVAQNLSLINRKLVRQGHVFSISGMRMWHDGGAVDDYTFSVSALPRTWMMFNSYKKARSLWNQMNLEAIAALGEGNLPKYYDFKVFFDLEHFDNHHNNDGGDLTVNLLPVDGDMNAFAGTGEWVYSKYETSASSGREMNIHMLGKHGTAAGVAEGSSGRDLPEDQGSIGCILAYQQSRGAAFTDQDLAGLDQNIDIDSPWAQLFAGDAQNQEVLTDLDADNDAPPYPADYAGGVEHGEGTLIDIRFLEGGDSQYFNETRPIPTFEAPLGLIKLDMNRAGSSTDLGGDVFLTYNAKIIAPC